MDALRGLAAALMIEQHLGNWLWGMPWINVGVLFRRHPILMGANAAGGLAAPTFVLLAGMGVALFAERHPDSEGVLVRRGLVLVAMGVVLNLVVPSWFTWGSWYVLHLLGLGLVLAPLANRASSIGLSVIALLALAATPLVQQGLGTPFVLDHRFMDDTGRPGGVLRLMLAEGHFPILPWLSVFFLGLAAGKWLVAGRRRPIAALAAVLWGSGILLALIGVLIPGATGRPLAHRFFTLVPDIYPCFPSLLLLLSGAVLVLVLLFTGRDETRWDSRHPLVCLGRCSLTLLILHVFVFRQVAAWLGFYKIFSSTVSGLLIVSILIGFGVLAVLWQRIVFRYGAEWLLRQL